MKNTDLNKPPHYKFSYDAYLRRKEKIDYEEVNPTLNFYESSYKGSPNPKRLEVFFTEALIDLCNKLFTFCKYWFVNLDNASVILDVLKNIQLWMYGKWLPPEQVCRDIDTLLVLVNDKESVNNNVASLLTWTSEIQDFPYYTSSIVKNDWGVWFEEFIKFFEHQYSGIFDAARKIQEEKVHLSEKEERERKEWEKKQQEEDFDSSLRNTWKAQVTDLISGSFIFRLLKKYSNITIDMTWAIESQREKISDIQRGNTIIDNSIGEVTYSGLESMEKWTLIFWDQTEVTRIWYDWYLSVRNSTLTFNGNVQSWLNISKLRTDWVNCFGFKNACRVNIDSHVTGMPNKNFYNTVQIKAVRWVEIYETVTWNKLWPKAKD